LDSLFDPSVDDLRSGKCCKNVKFREYPGCKGETCPKNPTNGPMEIASNYCVEIKNKDNFTWRLCFDKRSVMSKFHTQLSFNIMARKGKMDTKTLEKFMLKLSESKESGKDGLKTWHWDTQKNWKGQCQNKESLQSPINIETSVTKGSKFSGSKYGIEYTFDEVHTLVRKHYNELHVHFTESAGVFKLWVDNQALIYQPQYMSFRFPGEHLYNGKRYPGEVLIHLTEMNPNRKTWVTNGLVLSIPLNPKKDNPNLSFFENLNPDFWRMGVENDGQYIPKKVMQKQLLKFNLGDLFRASTSQNTDYFVYLGSQTVPPCTSNYIYIVLSAPIEISNCQFKVLRENSLLTDRPKEVHARLPQDLKDRKVYSINFNRVKFSPQIKSIIPLLVKKFQAYNRVIARMVTGTSKGSSRKGGHLVSATVRKAIKSCASANNPLAAIAIKTPLRPRTLKALNKHIAKINRQTIKAMRMRGPQAKQMRKEALAAVKAETGGMNCELKLK
jgi:carbonic anhydrase